MSCNVIYLFCLQSVNDYIHILHIVNVEDTRIVNCN